MTTAELIKKREEEKNKPLQETKPSFTGLGQVSDPAKANMETVDNTANNTANAIATMQNKAAERAADKFGNTPMAEPQKPSLYAAGVEAGNIGDSEKMMKGQSPITTPEYEKFRNEVIGARDFGVETEEEKKKRERADFIKQGLTGFTDGLTALANLYYTTKWAPNQKQTYQLPALQQQLYNERLERDKKLENFRAWQRAKAEKDADRAYQDAIRKEEAAENKRRWEYSAKKQEEAVAKADARYDAEQAYRKQRDEAADKKYEREYAEKVRHNKAIEVNAATKSSKSGSGRLIRIPRPNGEPMVFRKDDLENSINLSYIYDLLPEEYKVRDKSANPTYPKGEDGKPDYKAEPIYPISSNPTLHEQKSAIGRALARGAIQEIAEDIQVGASNPIHSNTQQSGTQQTNGDSGATDFSKQKRGGGQSAKIDLSQYEIPSSGGAQQTTMANVTPKPTDAAPSNTPQGNTQQGNVFEQLSAKYSKEDADEKAAKDAELQQRIADMETEKRDSLNLANEYQKELDELNKMQMLNPRNYAGSRKREVQDAINEVVARKKFLEKEIKELKAKAKNLDKEYERLYPYKKR